MMIDIKRGTSRRRHSFHFRSEEKSEMWVTVMARAEKPKVCARKKLCWKHRGDHRSIGNSNDVTHSI